jgi:arsenite methyltransferase
MTSDLMFQQEIREVVRDAYRQLPAGAGRAMAGWLYGDDVLETLPEPAVAWALGVGDPVRHAGLRPGEVVLDLGCGGGIDAVLAARLVGRRGRVIGVDLLPEMCGRARRSAELAGIADRCEFVEGEMEDLPLPSESVDVVISNGALNLSPRKSRALAEVARVLVPGGRICIADLAVEEDLPPEVLATEATWAGCIAGAVSERVLVKKLRRAGLEDVEVGGHMPFGIDDVATYPLFSEDVIDLMRRLIPQEAQQRVAVSLLARATKPVLAASAPRAEEEPESTHVRHLSDIAPDGVEAPGVVVRHLKSVEDVDLKVLEVEPGGATPYHVHPHAHEGVVLEGRGALRLEGGAIDLGPGHVFFVRPNERHAVVSRGRSGVRFVCMDCFV